MRETKAFLDHLSEKFILFEDFLKDNLISIILPMFAVVVYIISLMIKIVEEYQILNDYYLSGLVQALYLYLRSSFISFPKDSTGSKSIILYIKIEIRSL